MLADRDPIGPETVTPSVTVTLPFNSSNAMTRVVSESRAVKVVLAPEPARQRADSDWDGYHDSSCHGHRDVPT